MSRRHRAANSVSLFPFLAVLVCAMGALILLLIVTTRRVRSDALAKAEVVKPLPKAKPAPVVAAAPMKTPPIEKPPALARVTAKPDRPLLPSTVHVPDERWHSRTVEEPVNPNPALERTRARLEAQLAQRSKLLTAANARLRVAEREAFLLQQSIKASAEQQRAAEQRVASLKAASEKSRQEIRKNVAELDLLRRQIQRQREDYARASSEFSILPFEGDTGTTRRPIFIECTGRGYQFLPEGITLTAGDLSGFSPDYNPLLTAARGLVDYWSAKHRESNDEPKPYVMLLVRPSGSTTFYVARRLLKNLGHPIGYELVDDDTKLALPKADPRAQVACQVGARRAFAQRGKFVEALAGNDPTPGPQGRSIRFHRGTGRLEVIDPEKDASKNGTGFGSGQRRTTDPWRNVLNGRNAPRRTAQNAQGGPTQREGVANTERRPGTGYGTGFNRQPRRFAGAYGTGTGTAGTGTGGTGSGGTGTGGVGAGRFGNGDTEPGNRGTASSAANRFGGTRTGDRDSQTTANGRRSNGQRNSTQNNGTGNPGDEPGSPNGTTQGEAVGSNNQSPGNRSGGRSANGKYSRYPGGTNGGTAQSRGQQNGGTGSASASAGGEPGSPQSPSMSLGKFGSPQRFRAAKKRWGFSDAGATIGFEREVTVQTAVDRLVVGHRHVIRIGKGEPPQQLMRKLITAVEGEARSWGKPPRSFYWVPMLRFVVSPGGNQHYQRLRGEVHKIGLQSAVEYKLDGPEQPANQAPSSRGSN